MTSAPAPRPVLAVTLGDVAGIGPEITAKTLGISRRALQYKLKQYGLLMKNRTRLAGG